MISVRISFWMYMVLCDLQIWPEHWFIMHALQRRHELWVLDRGSWYFKFLKVHCWRIISIGEHIRCKPTSPCKPCKLQSGPLDQYPRGEAQGVGAWTCKSVITPSKSGRLIVKLPNLLCPLDADPMAQIQVCTKRLVCTWYIPLFKMVHI